MENYTGFGDNTLRDYLKILLRNRFVIFWCVVFIMAGVYIGLELQTPIYEARVKMLISAEKQIEATYYRELNGQNQQGVSQTQSEIVKSKPVLERAVKTSQIYMFPLDYEKKFASPLRIWIINRKIKELKKQLENYTLQEKRIYIFRKVVENLRKRITVEPVRDTNLFTISVRDFSPEEAARIANMVSRSYIIFDLEQQLAELMLKYGKKHPRVSQLKDNVDRISEDLSKDYLTNLEAIGPASVKIIDQATPPLFRIGASRKATLALAFAMSLILGIMAAFIFDILDQMIRSPEDIERFLNIPCLGSIRKKKIFNSLVIKNLKARNAYARSYQALSDQMHLLFKDKNIKSVLFTSSSSKTNCGVVITNLSRYLANKLKQKVLIIDANLRQPSIRRKSKFRKSPGLLDFLNGKNIFDEVAQEVDQYVSVVVTRRATIDPMAYLVSDEMKNLFEQAIGQYSLVLVNAASVENFKDPLALSDYVDGGVIVINEGKSRRQGIKRALGHFESKNFNILGGIMLNRTYPLPKFIYENV